MTSPLSDWFRSRPEGVTPEEFARDYLRLSGPSSVLRRIAREALDSEPGVRAGPDGRWRRIAPSRALALVAVATGPMPGVDHLLALGACGVAGGSISRPLFAVLRPGGPVAREALREAGVDLATARPHDEVAALLAPQAEHATLLGWSSRRAFRFLRHLLREYGRPALATEEIVLRPALRRGRIVPARCDLADAAPALGVTVPVDDDPGERARALAEIWLAARERGIDLEPAPPAAPFDFGQVGFGPERLEEIPEASGVYRFYDRDGALLYVGKARDLRQRVKSYFAHRTHRRRRHPELMARLWRLDWEETGSELGALLREVREIREKAPPLNIQREVRRRRPAAGDLVLFLPGKTKSRAELLFLRGGRIAGRLEVPRRRPPVRRIREALTTALSGPSPPEEDPAGAQVVASWLREQEDEQNLLDLSATGGVEDALRKVRDCLADPELFRGKFYRA